MERATMTKEQHEAMEKMESMIRRTVWQSETGLSAIAMLVPPLNVAMPDGLLSPEDL